MLVYPRAQRVIANTQLLALGTIEILPPVAPLTVFVWGPKRALPVKLTEFSITEEAHDLQAQPDPRQGLAGPARAQLQRPADLASRLLAVPRAPGRQGGDGPDRRLREPRGRRRRRREPRLMFDAASRYAAVETATLRDADGRAIAYVRRRFLPQGAGMPLLVEVDGGARATAST